MMVLHHCMHDEASCSEQASSGRMGIGTVCARCEPTVVVPDWLLVWLAFLAKAVFSLDVMPADTVGAMDAAAWQDAIACCVALGGGL